jgi:hypothetical protein
MRPLLSHQRRRFCQSVIDFQNIINPFHAAAVGNQVFNLYTGHGHLDQGFLIFCLKDFCRSYYEYFSGVKNNY